MGETLTASAPDAPRIPQPARTVSALREAIAQIAPAALPAFTRELDQAADQAGQGSDLAPLQRFASQWAIFVEIQRHPRTAHRFHELEELAEHGEAEQARKAATELGHILDDARTALAHHAR